MIKILNIVGARPNFMKVAPLHRAFEQRPEIESKIVHTGQHFDAKMSDVFFEQLQMPKPHYFLGVGGGSHTEVTAKTMLEFEKVLLAEKPDLVLVVGDVNATLACTLVAIKSHIPVAHVEAGLRSGDRAMPEELNRILTDSVSEYLFITEQSGVDNLKHEGVPDEKVFFVGNVMIDSLVHYLEKAKQTSVLDDLNLQKDGYAVVTMHRPANVDTSEGLEAILNVIEDTARYKKVVLPIHPRTANNFKKFGLSERLEAIEGLVLTEPQGYLEFLQLMQNATIIITDSGGIQEETTFLQIPCLTFRDSTERPITVEIGTNQLLADLNPVTVHEKFLEVLAGKTKKGQIPPLWDGHTSERIADILIEKLG
ncbi:MULTISPECIES: non-hydrolyzing UDP-N-acetylglucosamine 2-epimerase [unclassified Arcicella]|uniref:non-hydrolyzing UDP-N-acetylglucosamine 2-epimerase n=1 Tax=unclassified Arcicella TaxID=2644986 RepID=UPI002861C004|nr:MULTISPECIES: UDP-N-acetylglucosamine 2-epimerase (non-hydrolyzing) [unclassified Arcicella]MDR6563607.1 UDP-N-acetylglucosamine 2-epimerase (non-hydrolyzing) [Arcicella sp. BE51]MDR6814255.1 UDP-N-acetylglucosamine 2-epimerase (non-hydrolyzing) [Arcicella sp. BE140]MDR6825506.1 UDP-N-acetylglucosamine 2-epimerase (non-hydrolyzing) [Arcicella sp. BE139]